MSREIITYEEASDLYKDSESYVENCTEDEYDDSTEFEDDVEAYYNDELTENYFCEDFEDKELITDSELTDMYNDMLNEDYPELFGLSPSYILEECDPTQYREGINDYYDSICENYYCEEME